MEASPRDNEETATGRAWDAGYSGSLGRQDRARGAVPAVAPDHDRDLDPDDPEPESSDGDRAGDDRDRDGDGDGDGDETGGSEIPGEAPVEAQELRPQRKLRLWQLAPIVVLGALGSLMFAFPLAFEPGRGSGKVVSMLGLLICGCAAGWGVMAARRVGHIWPGLPPRGSGRRPDWRVLTSYVGVVGILVLLAVLRVTRLH